MAVVKVWFYQGAEGNGLALKEPHLGYDTKSGGGFIAVPPAAQLAAIDTSAATYYAVTPDSGLAIGGGTYPTIPTTSGNRKIIDVSRGGFLVLADAP